VNRIFSLIILTLLLTQSYGQDTLPNFTLTERGNKVIISWVNPFQSIIQLNVQRSFDSLTNFKTVYSAPSPELPQNGYSETKMPTNRIFYRIFYVFQGGSYFFSKSQRIGAEVPRRDVSGPTVNATGGSSGIITINIRETFYTKIPATLYRPFRDSVLQRTKDTLTAINDSLVVIRPYTGPDNFRPSIYIFTTRDGIAISLPSAASRRYKIKFFEENGHPLFEIPHVKEPQLILDKSNFFHAGWFLFELYEDERLKEKNKLFLSKDF
jgi:hypothetical protein